MQLPSINKMGSPIPVAMGPPFSQVLVSSELNLLQKVVQSTVQSSQVTIQRMENVRDQLHPVRLLQLSDGSRLVLKSNATAATPLLKSERQDLETEAQSLMILAKSGLPIPTVLRHDNSPRTLGSPFILTNRLPGVRLSTILPFLSRAERMYIDRQISEVENLMAQYTSSTFGPVGLVSSGNGFKRWREAYKSMLGSVLQDGEDMFVNLPYMQIREQVARAETALDNVQEARLIVMDLGDPQKILVDELTKEVTGVIDFKKALWGDVDMVTGDAATSLKGLL